MSARFGPRHLVIRMALFSELMLTTLALVWIYLFSTPVSIEFSFRGALYGVLAAIPMLICNLIIFGVLSREDSPWPIYQDFKKSVVIPICGNLRIVDALLIASISGFAEELLFRGALQHQLSYWFSLLAGVVLSSALFSYVHFIGVIRRYWQLALFYFLFGLYFSAVMLGSGNLFVPIITHALYNFVVILYLKLVEIPAMKSVSH